MAKVNAIKRHTTALAPRYPSPHTASTLHTANTKNVITGTGWLTITDLGVAAGAQEGGQQMYTHPQAEVLRRYVRPVHHHSAKGCVMSHGGSSVRIRGHRFVCQKHGRRAITITRALMSAIVSHITIRGGARVACHRALIPCRPNLWVGQRPCSGPDPCHTCGCQTKPRGNEAGTIAKRGHFVPRIPVRPSAIDIRHRDHDEDATPTGGGHHAAHGE
jgi:hypothetical protein